MSEGQAIKQPLTLEDVSNRMNAVCDEFVEAMVRTKAGYETNIAALCAEMDASPDLDKNAAASIVLGRLKKMMEDAQAVLGE